MVCSQDDAHFGRLAWCAEGCEFKSRQTTGCHPVDKTFVHAGMSCLALCDWPNIHFSLCFGSRDSVHLRLKWNNCILTG